jgi:cell division protein FtsI (penicillin-binding protein 3)
MSLLQFSKSPLLSQVLPVGRGRFVQLALLLGLIVLAARALYLQAFNTEFLQKKGESRYERLLEVPATRGRILDREGNPLAISTPVKSIWAIPEDVDLSPQQMRDLARYLGVDARELRSKLDTDSNFVYLARRVAPDVAEKVLAMGLAGIFDQTEYRRFYPAGETMSHMLGFTGDADAGLEGIERAFDRELSGATGLRRVIKDRRGNVVEDVAALKAPKQGEDLTLALDSKLQYLAYSTMKQALQEYHAKAGAVVLIDALTGEILALASLPAYNPNNRARLSGPRIRNRAFTDVYEPGSTIKPFIAALALESGRYKPETRIDAGNGKMTIGTAVITDTHPYSVLTLAEVIQKSSNIGISRIALGFGREEMGRYYDDLGFGKPLGLGFPGEVGGLLRPAKSWRPIEQATMSYGHGMAVTLIQLAHAYTIFATDGQLLPLSLTKRGDPPQGVKPVISAATAASVRHMLESVVSAQGTAPRAQVPGYRVGGKTGTAMKPVDGKYINKYVSSFVGLAPLSKPRLIAAVMLDEPSSDKHYGGEVAAPVFSKVMGGALRAMGVPFDAPQRSASAGAAAETSVP